MKNRRFVRCVIVNDGCPLTPGQHYQIIDDFQESWLLFDDFETLIYAPKDWFGNVYTLIPGGKK